MAQTLSIPQLGSAKLRKIQVMVFLTQGEPFLKSFFKSRLVLTLFTLILLATTLAASLAGITHVTTAKAAGSVDVFVGYADSLRANPTNFPTPWAGSPGITFEGCQPPSAC